MAPHPRQEDPTLGASAFSLLISIAFLAAMGLLALAACWGLMLLAYAMEGL